MTKQKKLASDATVKAQLASLTLENESLKTKHDKISAENVLLRKQNVELASVIDNDLKAEAKLRIMAVSDYKDSDLANLEVEQLQQIEETLTKAKGDSKLPYKSIHAGDVKGRAGLSTVGSLYGKTRDEILAMGGDY